MSTSESNWARLRNFLYEFIFEESLPNEIVTDRGFFQSPFTTHFTKSFLLSNPKDAQAFNKARLDKHPSLARIDVSVSTENFIDTDESDSARPTSNENRTAGSALPQRRYNFVMSAKGFDRQNNEISDVDRRGVSHPLQERVARGRSTPNGESENMAPLLGEIFDWRALVELLKHEAVVRTTPDGIYPPNPLEHRGILGYGANFRKA